MKRLMSFFLTVVMTIFISTATVYADNEEDNTVSAPFTSGYLPNDEPIYLKLKSGFDFLEQGSETLNWELALTGAVLSKEVYDFTSDPKSNQKEPEIYMFSESDKDKTARSTVQSTLIDLEYTNTCYYYYENSVLHPCACFGYKRYDEDQDGKFKNVFVIVVRGTHSFEDGITDFFNGGFRTFEEATLNVRNDFVNFAEKVTEKKIEDLKREDNLFLITGHSLGGGIANRLSITDTIVDLAGNDKNKIYTYTFEAPHSCFNYWWMDPKGMSNAFNFKDVDDAVTNVPPWAGATRYGTDLEFSVGQNISRYLYEGTTGLYIISELNRELLGGVVENLDNQIFMTLFPNVKGGSVIEAPKFYNYGDIFGHHDMGLPLTYILQQGIKNNIWDDVNDVLINERFMAGYRAAMRYPEGKVEIMEPIDFASMPSTSPRYWTVCACDQYNTEDKGAEVIDCGDYYELKNCLIEYPYFISQEIYDQFEDGYEFDLLLQDQNGQEDMIHNIVSYVDGKWVLSDNGDPYDYDARYVQEEDDGTISLRSCYGDSAWLGIIYRGSLFFTKDCIVHDVYFKGTETFEEYVTKNHPYPEDGEPWFQGGKNDYSAISFNGKVIFDPNTGMIIECQEIYQP